MIQIKYFIGGYDENLSYLIWCKKSKKLAEHLPDSEFLISYIYEHKEIATNKGIAFKFKELHRMATFFSKLYYNYEN